MDAASADGVVLTPETSASAQTDARGIELYRNGDFRSAVTELTPLASTKDSAGFRASMYLAGSYEQLGQEKEARRIFSGLVGKSFSPKKGEPQTNEDETPAKITKKTPANFGSAMRGSNSGEICASD